MNIKKNFRDICDEVDLFSQEMNEELKKLEREIETSQPKEEPIQNQKD